MTREAVARILLVEDEEALAEGLRVNLHRKQYDVDVAGEPGFVWATGARTSFGYRLDDGRWYSEAEERTRARVAVVERAIARQTGTKVGDRLLLQTAAGRMIFAQPRQD